MTPTEPGRALDALVAEKVMGLVEGRDFGEWPAHDPQDGGETSSFTCKRCFDSSGWINESEIPRYWPGPCVVEPPPYSTSIAAAWQVVERMREQGWGHKHQVYSGVADIPGVWWTFMKPGMAARSIVSVEAATVSHAVCLAALRAVGHD